MTQCLLKKGNTISFSVLTNDAASAQKLYDKASQNQQVTVIQSPSENEFADFYAVIEDPFGIMIQITKEKQFDAN